MGMDRMRLIIKSVLNWLVTFFISTLSRFSVGHYISEQIIKEILNKTKTITHDNLSFEFSVANKLNKFRADTFSSKEPETLEWIDGFSDNAVLWDIGANVGLYSCYAAKKKGARVFAFEPSVFNLELLARNVFINNLVNLVTIVPLALSEKLMFSSFKMTTTDWGGAMSTFDESYGHDGLKINSEFEFTTVGLSMEDAVGLLKIPQPDYIKMDVDGIEHLILKSGGDILRNTKGILIEINDKFIKQAEDASMYLKDAGFVLKEKRHAEFFDHIETAAKYTFNQIWVKNS